MQTPGFKKNDEIILFIDDMSVKGEGIGHKDNMTFFVPGAVDGDEILTGVTKVKKNYAYGRIIKILKESEYRVEEKCCNAGKCGGCSLQAVSYEHQLRIKEKRLKDCLKRIGGFKDEEIALALKPIVPADEGQDIRYRNKAQFPVSRDKENNIKMGFYAMHSHRIIETDDCLLLHPKNKDIIRIIKSFMKEFSISCYDEEKGTGLIRNILIRFGYNSGEIMVCVVINGKTLPHADILYEKLLEIEGFKSLSININHSRGNNILSDKTKTLFGSDGIIENIGDIKFKISPNSFFQINPYQTKKLYEHARGLSCLTGREIVFDLYCGIGTISLFLARDAYKVFGVEIVPDAIRDAKENALLNGIKNAEFLCGKAEDVFPKLIKEKEELYKERERVVVIDPPRKGSDTACLDAIIKIDPVRVIYVSCDPATLSRDLLYLKEKGGYEPQEITPYDQFPNSNHVETVVLMSRVEGK